MLLEAWGADQLDIPVAFLSVWGWLLLVVGAAAFVAWWSLRSGPRRGGMWGRDW